MPRLETEDGIPIMPGDDLWFCHLGERGWPINSLLVDYIGVDSWSPKRHKPECITRVGNRVPVFSCEKMAHVWRVDYLQGKLTNAKRDLALHCEAKEGGTKGCSDSDIKDVE